MTLNETTDIDAAIRICAEGVVNHSRLLLNAACVAGGVALVQRVEAALRSAEPELRVSLNARGNASLVLTVGDVEVFRGQGVAQLPADPSPAASITLN